MMAGKNKENKGSNVNMKKVTMLTMAKASLIFVNGMTSSLAALFVHTRQYTSWPGH